MTPSDKLTDFQKKAYEKLSEVKPGYVTTYKDLATALNTKAFRAIGTAMAKNPYAPKVPCHRVVRSDGKIGNYSAKGGIKKKIQLLRKEGIIIKNNRIKDMKNKKWKF